LNSTVTKLLPPSFVAPQWCCFTHPNCRQFLAVT
jgi:hypothetical protein